MYPTAERQRAPAPPTTTRSPGPAEKPAREAAGGPPRLPAVPEAARHVQVLGLVAAGRADSRHHSRLQRHAGSTTRSSRTLAATVNYTLNSSTFLEATYGQSQNALTGCALAQASTGPTFCRNAFPMNDISQPRPTPASAGLPMLFPNAQRDRSRTTSRTRRCRASSRRSGTAPGSRCRRASRGAARIANAPPNMPFPGYPEHQHDQRLLDQPDEGDAGVTR